MAQHPDRLEVVQRFFAGTGNSYDLVARLCTCGLDLYWKRRIISLVPPGSARILDQACGTGILTLQIARAFPGSLVTGVELREEYLEIARRKARAAGVDNVRFLCGRAEEVMPDTGYDCITSSYLAKYAELEPLLDTVRSMLRPGGLLVMHDFTLPSFPLYRFLWHAYFGLLRTVGGAVWPEWRTVFHELPGFLRESRWLPDLLRLLPVLGFNDIRCSSHSFGTAAIVTARRS
jgi:demethylmenaquinone methyltransferase/2-methoxy-6-polyprenyl-1,4-benzoquinol methylase